MSSRAEADIDSAYECESEQQVFYLPRSIARSLVSITEHLERIDDALRNTIGGNPR